MIFAQPLHYIIIWPDGEWLHDTEQCQKQKATQKIEHGAMGHRHHGHLPVIQGTVVSKRRDTGSDLTTQMDGAGFSRGEHIVGQARTIPTAPKADYCTEDRTTQLQRKVEQRQNHEQSNSAVQRPW